MNLLHIEEFKNDVDALGTALINIGLKGGRVAIIGENRYEWAVSYMAVVNGTGIVVPLDKELPENEIESLLTRAKADAVIFSGSLRSHMLNISKRIRLHKALYRHEPARWRRKRFYPVSVAY
ncbi:MAG: AMP-binding protein [Acetivibrionales bacterium]